MNKTTKMCQKFGVTYCDKSKCKFKHFNECPNELNLCKPINSKNNICIDFNCKYVHNVPQIIDNHKEEGAYYPPISINKLLFKQKNNLLNNWIEVAKKENLDQNNDKSINLKKIKSIVNSYDDPYILSKDFKRKTKLSKYEKIKYIEETECIEVNNNITTTTTTKTTITKTIRKKKNKSLIMTDEEYEECLKSSDQVLINDENNDKIIEKIKNKPLQIISNNNNFTEIINNEKYLKILNIKVNKKLMKINEIKDAYVVLQNLIEDLNCCNKKREKIIKNQIHKSKIILNTKLNIHKNKNNDNDDDNDSDSETEFNNETNINKENVNNNYISDSDSDSESECENVFIKLGTSKFFKN
jgi:hypothetical protein